MTGRRAAPQVADRNRRSAVAHAALRSIAAVLPIALAAGCTDADSGAPMPPARGGEELPIYGLDADMTAIMRRQEALNPALAILNDAARADASSGFTSLAFEGNGLTLYWKGALPAGMQAALAAARAIGPVEVRATAFSRAELAQSAARIEAAAAGQSDLQSIALRGDGGGLVIEKMPAKTQLAVAARIGALVPTEQILAAADVGVPVELTTAATTMQAQTCPNGVCNRTDDEAAWNSGGYVKMKHSSDGGYYGACTGGFAVTVPVFGDGLTYMLTAAHCASWHAGLGDFFYDKAGEFIGRAMPNEDWDKDILLIDARGFRWMWDGTTATTIHKTVHSWGLAANGEMVCLSGATSGTRCWLQTQPNFIYSYQLTDSDGDTFSVHGMVRTCKTMGAEPASQNGDSGAPVFTLDGDGVRAKGVHSGGDGTCTLFQDMADVTTDRSGAWARVVPVTF